MVESVTDNKNRTVAEVRHAFSKNGGSIAESGAVSYGFDRKGVITLPEQGKTEEEVMEIVLDAGADDIELDEGYFEITTSLESFEPVRKALIEAGLEVENASLQWIAQNTIEVKGEASEKVMKLIDMLEDNDDVQNVFTNADFADE